MSVQWGQIRSSRTLSFHLFRTFTRMPGRARAVCNRNLDAATVVETRPGNAKTCETCLRFYLANVERTEDDPGMGNTL